MEMNRESASDTTTLSQLRMGQTGVICSVRAVGMVRNRLLDLGFLPGTPVTAIRRAPFGDPTSFRIRGAVLALRAQDSSLVAVARTPMAESRTQPKAAMEADAATLTEAAANEEGETKPC